MAKKVNRVNSVASRNLMRAMIFLPCRVAGAEASTATGGRGIIRIWRSATFLMRTVVFFCRCHRGRVVSADFRFQVANWF